MYNHEKEKRPQKTNHIIMITIVVISNDILIFVDGFDDACAAVIVSQNLMCMMTCMMTFGTLII